MPSPASSASSPASGPVRSSSPSRREAAPAEREPTRLADGADVPRVEARPVGVHGAHSDADCVRLSAQLVDEPAALLAGDPALAGDRQPAVERHRRLVGHERPVLGDPRPPGLVLGARLEDVGVLDLDPGRAKHLEPASGLRVRVERSGDDPAHPRAEHGLRAGRRRPWCAQGSMVR